ncbi:hypothetical protein, partial [Azospirillum baldaniorum]|uniref:hypothetical protein n=1 Tax=Azospirillum baldaniorum TaxID=1064539 RepID=UPI001B3B9920
RIPSHNTVSTISKIPRLQENRNTPRPFPSRSGPPGPKPKNQKFGDETNSAEYLAPLLDRHPLF